MNTPEAEAKMDDVERQIRAKVRAEVEAAKARWAPDVPDWASPYRRGLNLALLVIDGRMDEPLSQPVTMTAMEIGGTDDSACPV